MLTELKHLYNKYISFWVRRDPSEGLAGNDKQVVGVYVCVSVFMCVCVCVWVWVCVCVLAGYWGSVNSVEYI